MRLILAIAGPAAGVAARSVLPSTASAQVCG